MKKQTGRGVAGPLPPPELHKGWVSVGLLTLLLRDTFRAMLPHKSCSGQAGREMREAKTRQNENKWRCTLSLMAKVGRLVWKGRVSPENSRKMVTPSAYTSE